jgi:hypothetical protein
LAAEKIRALSPNRPRRRRFSGAGKKLFCSVRGRRESTAAGAPESSAGRRDFFALQTNPGKYRIFFSRPGKFPRRRVAVSNAASVVRAVGRDQCPKNNSAK